MLYFLRSSIDAHFYPMFSRMNIILSVAAVCGAIYAAVPLPAFLSLMIAFAAVIIPHTLILFLFPQQFATAPFAFWAAKFMLTVALLMQSLRVLDEAAALSSSYYLGGVILAVILNIAVAARYSPRQQGRG